MKNLMTKENLIKASEKLNERYPNAVCALEYTTPYELLVATMLSAQCTDARVNMVTRVLFEKYNTPQSMVTLSNQQLEEYIHSCGFFRSKADNILKTSRILLDAYNGEVPRDKELLQKLPGVGRKTANVVCAVVYNIPGIAVDTHVFRVANRIGFTSETSVLNTELSLMRRIPESEWINMHHILIMHGRNCCKAQRPMCRECCIGDLCLYKGKNTDVC